MLSIKVFPVIKLNDSSFLTDQIYSAQKADSTNIITKADSIDLIHLVVTADVIKWSNS